MLSLIVRRVLSAIPMLFLLSLVSFFLIRSLPGDPVDVMLGSAQKEIPADQLQVLRHEFGLDTSPASQYWLWLRGWFYPGNPTASATGGQPSKRDLVAQNALGLSYRDGRPVRSVIGAERLPTCHSFTCGHGS